MPFDPDQYIAEKTPSSSFDPDSYLSAKGAPAEQGMIGKAIQPLKNIPGAIAEEFRGGAKEISDTYKSQRETLGKGEIPSKLSGLGYVTGGLREAMSPVTGTVKAVVEDPVKNAAGTVMPKHAADFLGNLTGDAAAMFGPMALGKSAQAMVGTLPGLDASVKTLMNEGVRLTPGQMFTSAAKKIEETIGAVPLVGSFIKRAELDSLKDFNRAALNRALKPYGEKVPDNVPMGRQGIAYVDRALGKRYDELLPKLQWNLSNDFENDVASIANKNDRRLDDSQRRQWAASLQHIRDNLLPTAQGASMDGHAFKQVESELSYLAKSNYSSPQGHVFADQISELRGAFRDQLERSNPQYAKELQELNTAWATFARAQGASIRNVGNGGLFTPQDLLRDVKSEASRGVYGRGEANLQDLADAGAAVLPGSLRSVTGQEMGLYERGLWLSLLGGAEAGYGPAIVSNPAIMGTAAGGTALYSRPGIKAVNAAVRGAPNIGTGASQSPAVGAGAAAAQEQGQQ